MKRASDEWHDCINDCIIAEVGHLFHPLSRVIVFWSSYAHQHRTFFDDRGPLALTLNRAAR